MKTQMPIGNKFVLTSGMLILLTIVLGVASLVGLNSIGKRAKALSEDAPLNLAKAAPICKRSPK